MSPKRPPVRVLRIVAVLAATGLGCRSPEAELAKADAEATGILHEKQRAAFGETRPFDVRTPADRVRDLTVDGADGLATRPTALALDLRSTLQLAARNSREFQDRKERLYAAALQLIRERERFRPSPFFRLGGGATVDDGELSVDGDAELGVTKVLERGGTFALSVGGNFLRFVTSPTAENAASFLNLVVSLPLLRGAGELVALESLRQEERNVVYALREFERFKQTFAVRVATEYLRLLASSMQVDNEIRNLENVSEARRRNEALAEAQRLTQIEVDQARQDELRARNRVLVQRNNFQEQLDRFKQTLGVPVDLSTTVDVADLDALRELLALPFERDDRASIARALELRLDLQNVRDQTVDAERRVRIAEDLLLPDLTLALGATPTSDANKPLKLDLGDGRYTAGFEADLGLDRDLERVALRQAHLDLSSARRAVEDLEDAVKADVRSALRTVAERRETYDIQRAAVEVAVRRRESVIEFRNRGDASTRDLLEAQEALVDAENALAEALVEYRVAYLEFYRDTGALVVRPEGLDHATSDALLDAP
ncbi:MAG TPA: TolC family protein [Planctomycetota bacterium]|nr:TolC family protein [Planctomycetota bacterium]